MADTYINRSFGGQWISYQIQKPIIEFKFNGYRNTGMGIGCTENNTGIATYSSDKTYRDFGADGKHAYGVRAWFNGTQWIVGFVGFTKNQLKYDNNIVLNIVTGSVAKGLIYTTREETNIAELVFRYQHDSEDFYNQNEIIGTKDFSAEIVANCPIIRTDTNRNLVLLKDGRKVPLTTSVLLSDIAESEFLNSFKLSDLDSNYYIKSSIDSYTLLSNGNKKDVVSMTANTSWTEKNDSRQSSPYLVETKYNGFKCLKLFPTVKVDTSTYDATYNGVADYGNGNVEVSIYELYTTYPTIDAPQTSILKNLGYYYINRQVKEQTGDTLKVIQPTVFDTNIPIFADEQTGFNWSFANTNGDIDTADNLIKDALNYGELDAFNPIGDNIVSMLIDAGYTQQAMAMQFAMPKGTLSELANNLFNTDTSISSAISEGLKMYGANPVNVIIDLQYYPFNVVNYVQNSIDSYIYFGSYKMDFNGTLNKLYNTKCVIDCGTLIYPEQTNTFLDYEPFTELYIYLPYIGVNKLDIASYINRIISLSYIVDIMTGKCSAVLKANDIITDTFSGEIGAKQCISSIDYASYAQNKVKNVANIGNNMLKFAEGGLQGLSGTTGSVDIANGAIGFAQSLYDGYQSQNSQHISIRGSNTPTTSFAMPQYAYFYTIRNETIFPDNEKELIGYPSISGGKVKDFSGFLKCSKVSLISNCTVAEKKEIYELLQNGIYI